MQDSVMTPDEVREKSIPIVRLNLEKINRQLCEGKRCFAPQPGHIAMLAQALRDAGWRVNASEYTITVHGEGDIPSRDLP